MEYRRGWNFTRSSFPPFVTPPVHHLENALPLQSPSPLLSCHLGLCAPPTVNSWCNPKIAFSIVLLGSPCRPFWFFSIFLSQGFLLHFFCKVLSPCGPGVFFFEFRSGFKEFFVHLREDAVPKPKPTFFHFEYNTTLFPFCFLCPIGFLV